MQQAMNLLIDDLAKRTNEISQQAEKLLALDYKILNHKISHAQWSALECIEHLNRYGDFYLPEISMRLEQANPLHQQNPVFKSGRLGNYFAKMMLPGPDQKNMDTFKSMNPAGSQLGKEVLQKFIQEQKRMLRLLDAARRVDLNKVKTAVSITKWLKLKLGDTFRVVIYHNERHILQAQRAVAVYSKEKFKQPSVATANR